MAAQIEAIEEHGLIIYELVGVVALRGQLNTCQSGSSSVTEGCLQADQAKRQAEPSCGC